MMSRTPPSPITCINIITYIIICIKNFQEIVDYPPFEHLVEIVDHPPFVKVLIFIFFFAMSISREKIVLSMEKIIVALRHM
jgi:hypothetical protein